MFEKNLRFIASLRLCVGFYSAFRNPTPDGFAIKAIVISLPQFTNIKNQKKTLRFIAPLRPDSYRDCVGIYSAICNLQSTIHYLSPKVIEIIFSFPSLSMLNSTTSPG